MLCMLSYRSIVESYAVDTSLNGNGVDENLAIITNERLFAHRKLGFDPKSSDTTMAIATGIRMLFRDPAGMPWKDKR
ncbi:hypothetical protein BGAL_0467g00060 [Botrytis galanthina]|uniref:Uncharacterized protein n=1 Tax=Botrytis galanthina TaxID=278940 RepID=A0A4S8QLG9_9HELO|nr:hypothetical protein BGAL_0467g00060 [Botrytis galanthina]